jgi:hypothetical protein
MDTSLTRRRFLAGATLFPFCVNSALNGLAADAQPDDCRLQPLKDLDGYFPFTPPSTRAEWEKRAERVRRQLLVSLGLWPLPTRSLLNPVIHGGLERENYRVEKVFFESAPGFFVTGSLYRPLKVTQKVPGVLFGHGHWEDGRMMDMGADAIRQQIAIGAEHFEEGGRSIMQALCVGLARMGCAVFHYDMIGYADSQQIPFDLAHKFATQRPEMNTTENWGLFSPQAETHLQSVMGLQTWNSMRALDFLLTLPEVDPERVACTGASGGGTQTFILSALDTRVKVAFPAVMVSTAMQGGCTCENACLLRVGTGNVEIAALIAPRPLGMTCANDWTREMSTRGFPELKQLYTLMGAPDNVALFRGEHFEHNYNSVSRVACYGWFNQHFKLGFKEPIIEKDYQRLTREQLTVWDAQHPQPPGGPDFEKRLLQILWKDTQQQVAAAAQSPDQFRQLIRPALEVVLGRTFTQAGKVQWTPSDKQDRGAWLQIKGKLDNLTFHESLPVTICQPKQWNGKSVAWLSDQGKSGLFDGDKPIQPVQSLLDSGFAVWGIDLLYQGEFLPNGQPITKTRRVKNPRESAAYTLGYNDSLFAQRVHDVLTLLQGMRTSNSPAKKVIALALDPETAPVLAAALSVADQALDAAAIRTHGFRFGKVLDVLSVNFLPGGARYGDLPGMIALGQVASLWLADEPASTMDMLAKLSTAKAVRYEGSPDKTAQEAALWVSRL